MPEEVPIGTLVPPWSWIRGRETAGDGGWETVEGDVVVCEGLVAGVGDEFAVAVGVGDDAGEDFVGCGVDVGEGDQLSGIE